MFLFLIRKICCKCLFIFFWKKIISTNFPKVLTFKCNGLFFIMIRVIIHSNMWEALDARAEGKGGV